MNYKSAIAHPYIPKGNPSRASQGRRHAPSGVRVARETPKSPEGDF